MKQLLLIICALTISLQASSTVLNIPGTFPTISAALTAATAYDTILVAPGIYNENITWPAKAGIKLMSSGGSAVTTINGGGTGRVLNFTSSIIDTTTHIVGFIITGGYIGTGSGYGAGLYLSNASVTMEDLVIRNNRVYVPGGHAYGAGIHLSNSISVMRNCTVMSNSIDSATWCYGGGIYISGGAPELIGVVIMNNSARAEKWCYGVGLYARNGATLKLTNIEISQNVSGNDAIWYYGNGMYMDDVNATLTNVLVVNNQSGSGGSFNYGGGIYCDGTSVVQMMHVTIANNTKTGGAAITGSGLYSRDAAVQVTNSIAYNPNSGSEIAFGGTGAIVVDFSNVRNGYAGNSNINLTPGFVSASDYHLTPASPCTGAGTLAGSPYFDLDGNTRPLPSWTNPDMGCYEVDQSATGIQDNWNELTNKLKVYPNPAKRNSLIYIENVLNKHIIITDMKGGLVFEEQSTIPIFNFYTESLQPGMYLIHTGEKSPAKLIIH
jgi:hypothetical protein